MMEERIRSYEASPEWKGVNYLIKKFYADGYSTNDISKMICIREDVVSHIVKE